MKTRALIIPLLWLLLLPAGAQTDTAACHYKKPVLNDHPFHISDGARSPFIKTYLAGAIGLGSTGNMTLPGLEVGDVTILQFTGELLFLNGGLDYRQKVNDWLAFFLSYELIGRVGDDIDMMLVDGLNSLSGGDIGWLFRLYHNEKFQLSGTLFLQNMSGSFFDIVGYITDILDSVPNPRATKNIPVMNGGVGVKGAWAPNETFGVLFETSFLYGESFARGVKDFFMGVTLTGDVDFNPRYKVPVGLNFGYTFSSEPKNTLLEFNNTNILHFRIAYTGSCDYNVGLQFSFFKYELANIEERKPWVSNTSLGFRLYF